MSIEAAAQALQAATPATASQVLDAAQAAALQAGPGDATAVQQLLEKALEVSAANVTFSAVDAEADDAELSPGAAQFDALANIYLALPRGAARAKAEPFYLIFLLAANRLKQFHARVYALSAADAADQTVAQVLAVERAMSEGDFLGLRAASAALPPSFAPLFAQVLGTARRRVAASLAGSCRRMPLALLQEVLALSSLAEVTALAQASGDWSVQGDAVVFSGGRGVSLEGAAAEAASHTEQRQLGYIVGYASELERIV